MAEFILELYLSRHEEDFASAAAERARAAAEELARGGVDIRYVRSIFVPDDETCFLLFEAASSDAVHVAARQADLRFDRISEAVGAPGALRR